MNSFGYGILAEKNGPKLFGIYCPIALCNIVLEILTFFDLDINVDNIRYLVTIYLSKPCPLTKSIKVTRPSSIESIDIFDIINIFLWCRCPTSYKSS